MSLADAQLLFDQAKALVDGRDDAIMQAKTPRFHDPVNKALDILVDASSVLERDGDESEEAHRLREKIDVLRRVLIEEMVE